MQHLKSSCIWLQIFSVHYEAVSFSFTLAYFHSAEEHSSERLCVSGRVWTSLAGALGVGTSCMSSVRSCRRAGRQPHTCHLYPAPLPGLPVDVDAHLSVKGGLIFQGNCLANHTLKVIVGFLSALSLHVTQKASVGETESRKLTLIMCHHG